MSSVSLVVGRGPSLVGCRRGVDAAGWSQRKVERGEGMPECTSKSKLMIRGLPIVWVC